MTTTRCVLNSIAENFFALVRYAIGTDDGMPNISLEEWPLIYRMAEQQAILGIIYEKITELKDKRIDISREILFSWLALTEQIKQQNIRLNLYCTEVVDELHKDGFQCCILKGQGNARMYHNPYIRMPGDIDVWVRTKSDGRCKKDDVIRYAKMQNPKAEVRIYHVEYEWKGIPVELHFMPGIMNNPYYNRRLQRWYNKKSDEEFTMAELPDGVGKIPIPTVEFNIVFQLAHMMHHFFDEGIGLRQFVDYYYLLKSVHGERLIVLGDVEETLKYLNLYSFAGAVMYIMKEVLGLEEEYQIVPVDDRRGKTLLNEIQIGGNFGHHSGLDQKNALKKYFQKTWRNMRLVKEYPAEALCEPFFRTWHFFWRLAH